jgi:type I restriction enzyme M protein
MNNHINSANLGFEKEIFSAADKLRGNIDAAEYKNVVLGLIFLKYISDSFEDRYQELVDEGEGFEEDRDEYLAENIFFVPKEARWDFIASKAIIRWGLLTSARAILTRCFSPPDNSDG